MKSKSFLFAWDMTGIESIVPLDQYKEWDKKNTWNALADKPTERNPVNSIIQHIILRARFNTQRCYEVYIIDSEVELDEAEWRKLWEADPQYWADLVREKGNKLYSDRRSTKTQRII